MQADNFRQLFTLQYNTWAEHKKSQYELWPLEIDNINRIVLSEEEMYERNKQVIEAYYKSHPEMKKPN